MERPTSGVLIYTEYDAFELRLVDGQVLACNRNHDDEGHPLETWRVRVIGTPEEAKNVWPGLAAAIDRAAGVA